MTDKIEALREKAEKDAIYLGAGYIRIDANGSAELLDPSCVQILSEDGLSELDRLRSSNEAMRKALHTAEEPVTCVCARSVCSYDPDFGCGIDHSEGA